VAMPKKRWIFMKDILVNEKAQIAR
jgi:hypothetical protein